MSGIMRRSWLPGEGEAWLAGGAAVCLIAAALVPGQPYRGVLFGGFFVLLAFSLVAFIRRPKERSP